MIKNYFTQSVKFIQHNITICLIAFYTVSMVIPLIPFSVSIYYLMLCVIFMYMATRNNIKLNLAIILFFFAAALSIILSHPPAIFRSWERLGLLILVTGAVFPLFQSEIGYVFHIKLLKVTLWLFIIVGVVSFGCYLLGINYMRTWVSGMSYSNVPGSFGGITQHSMILGPLSAFGSIYLSCKLIFGLYERPVNYILWIIVIICLISTLVSASRGALMCSISGILLCLFLRYQGRLGVFIRKIILILVSLIICYPLLSDYASGMIAKQQANENSGSTFSSRNEKWANRMNEFEQNPLFGVGFASIYLDTAEGSAATTRNEGVVEPGSTWLAILSMTGILGAIPIYILVFGTLIKLINRVRQHPVFEYSVLLALLTANIIHQFAEGYALAGGSYLCFFFWLLLGGCVIITSYDNDNILNINL